MRRIGLRWLDRQPSFALLGPGFGGRLLLLGPPLGPADRRGVVLVEYEERSGAPRLWDGPAEEVEIVDDGAEGSLASPEELDAQIDGAWHGAAVEEIRAAIADGDVYQVNLTARVELRGASAPLLWSRMTARGAPRFAAWVRLPDGREIVSAAPELLFRRDGESIAVEPMKGTAPIGQAAWLEASEKDRAELAMIVDLMRHDLAPVCRPGSVRVACARRLVELPYAVQAIGDVEGALLPGATLADILATLHPGGSVTGAPKHAAIAMARRLELDERGPYCGTLGLVDGERATFSLLIRTAFRRGGRWLYGVGGGIVHDSIAVRELAEARLKLRALGEPLAGRGRDAILPAPWPP